MFPPPALDQPRILTIPAIRVAFALSLALHAAMLWAWFPRLHQLSFERSERDKASGPLVVELAPEPTRAASVPSEPAPAPVVRAPPPRPKPAAAPKAPPRPPPTPPVIARQEPAPAAVPPPDTPAVAAPGPTPVEGDFSSYLEARRRARGAAPDGGLSMPPVAAHPAP